MLPRAAVIVCVLASICAVRQVTALTTQQVVLDPFDQVDSCLPINILVQPNATAGAGYSLVLEAEDAVLATMSYNVSDRTLQLSLSGEIDTTQPIKITVNMPQGALLAVYQEGAGSEVFVAPGFSVPNFVASIGGTGRMYIANMTVETASLQSIGTGDIVLTGSIGSVNVSSSGTSDVWIAGVSDTVSLDLKGTGNTHVQPAQPTAVITGSNLGTGAVLYSSGTCTVPGQFLFQQVCQLVDPVFIPPVTPAWTCGLKLSGSFQCSTGNGTSSSDDNDDSFSINGINIDTVGDTDIEYNGSALPTTSVPGLVQNSFINETCTADEVDVRMPWASAA